jgi:HK97 gp10 family phage protein
MAQDVVIKGGKEVGEFLKTLPAKIRRNVIRSALRAGAKVIADEAKANAPVQDGDLRRSIRVSTRVKGDKASASAKVGNKKVWYSHFVEFGTAAHRIAAKNGKVLSFNGVFRKEVMHPGTRAKPFMRPALDAKSTEAINAVGRHIGKRLTKLGLNAPPDFEVDDER